MSLSRSLVSPAFSRSSAIGGEPGGEGSKDRHWLVSSMVVRVVKTGSKSFGRETLKLSAGRQNASLPVLAALGADCASEEAAADGRRTRVKKATAVPAVGCSHFPGQRLEHESLPDAAEQRREKPPRQRGGGEKNSIKSPKNAGCAPSLVRCAALLFCRISLIDQSVSLSLSSSLGSLLPLQCRVTTARLHAAEVFQKGGRGGIHRVGGWWR